MAIAARWGSFVVMVWALAACGGSSKTEDEDPIEEDPVDTYPLGRFADEMMTTFAVPVSGTEGGFFVANRYSGEMWRLIDMNGDAKPDLVFTTEPGTTGVFGVPGNPHWRVYLNDGTRFAATATEWVVPAPAVEGQFGAADVDSNWHTFDITGDGQPDLVHLTDSTMGGAVWDHGTNPHWRVYANSGTGFAATATDFSLPIDPSDDGLFRLEHNSTSYGAWRVLDFDGDDKPDLVRTSEPAGTLTVLGFGTAPHWEFHKNIGTGFATTAANITVPATGSTTRGLYLADSAGWTTGDVDGDGAIEIVVTADDDGDVQFTNGSPVWKRHALSGTAFSGSATDLAVPTTSIMGGFSRANMDDGAYQWSSTDLDGDGRLDFVVTSNSSAPGATVWGAPESPQWKFYRGGATGFDRDTHSWTVPDSGTGPGFFSLESNAAEEGWIVIDLTGDGIVELVQTADPEVETGAVFGFAASTPTWHVYPAAPSFLQLGE